MSTWEGDALWACYAHAKEEAESGRLSPGVAGADPTEETDIGREGGPANSLMNRK